MTVRMVHLSAHVTAAETSARTITGTATVYGRTGNTSAGPTVFAAGSIHLPEDLRRVKLLVDHDTAQPVGYLTNAADDPDALTVTFHVPAGTAGDEALAQARDGLRDGLSVGVEFDEDGYTVADGVLTVTAGALREVSLCALPAYDDARVSDVAATTTPGRTLMDPEETETPTVTATAEPTPPTPAPASAQVVAAAAPITPTSAAPRRVSAAHAARVVSTVVRRGGSAADVRAALNDITPTTLNPVDGEDPFLRDTFLGELWTASKVERPFVDALGTPKDITGLKVYGWKWETRPTVGTYAGEKTEIPTSEAEIVPAEAGVSRIAGGWDVDRIYVDLGDASLIEALWSAAVEDYKRKTEAAVVAALVAAATAAPATASLPAALVQLGATASALGAGISAVGIAPDLWASFANLTKDEVPWWLGSGDSINLGTTKGTVGGTSFFVAPALAAGTYLALDSRAATFYEKNPPVRVNAIDLAHGGVDLGLFGYHGLIVNDARALITGTITAPVAP